MRRREAIRSIAAATILPWTAAGGTAQPAKRTFTVATFNVNWGNPNLEEVVKVISQSQADLVALQEINDVSQRYLRSRLAGRYPHMKFRLPTGRYLAAGFGFLSKILLEGFRYVEAKHGLFGTWICHARPAGRRLQIVNVHLTPFSPPGRGGLAAAWQTLADVEDTHDKEIRHVHDALSKNLPAIVLGDFNSPSPLAAPQFLAKRGFTDSFAAVTKAPDRHPTWHWRLGKVNLAFRLDYIFHNKDISTLESRLVRTNASDHNVLVSRLLVPLAAEK